LDNNKINKEIEGGRMSKLTVIVQGDSGGGKTTLMNRIIFMLKVFDQYYKLEEVVCKTNEEILTIEYDKYAPVP